MSKVVLNPGPQGGGGGPSPSPLPPSTPTKKTKEPVAPEADLLKNNPLLTEKEWKMSLGFKASEYTATGTDLKVVDIDAPSGSQDRHIIALGISAPVYSVALTDNTIKAIVREGYTVREMHKYKPAWIKKDGSLSFDDVEVEN